MHLEFAEAIVYQQCHDFEEAALKPNSSVAIRV